MRLSLTARNRISLEAAARTREYLRAVRARYGRSLAQAADQVGETADWWWRRENGTPLTVGEWAVIDRTFPAADLLGPRDLLCALRDGLIHDRDPSEGRRAPRDVSEDPLDLGAPSP